MVLDKYVDKTIKVYAVTSDNQLIDYNTADNTAIGVALVAGSHKFMIEKTENYDTNQFFSWQYEYTDLSLINYNTADGTNSSGFLGSSLSTDFTTWTAGALADFDGKTNTAVIAANSSVPSDMFTVLNTFNTASDGRNVGYNDWYVPACGQLALMYLAYDNINAALSKIGGTALAGFNYWSSTEKSEKQPWDVNLDAGSLGTYGLKNEYARLRFIRDLE